MYPKNELHSPLHIAFNKIGNDQAEKRRFIYRPLDKD